MQYLYYFIIGIKDLGFLCRKEVAERKYVNIIYPCWIYKRHAIDDF